MRAFGENYSVSELAKEAGKLVVFLLAGAAWTMLILMLVVD